MDTGRLTLVKFSIFDFSAYKSLKRHVVKSAGVIWSLCHAKFAFIGYMREDMVVDETC